MQLLNSYGLPLTLFAAIGWFLWVWGFNRSENPLRRGHFTKLMDVRIVNEEKVGQFMEVAGQFMETERARLKADEEWKVRQLETCSAHVAGLEKLAVHQDEHNQRADKMIGELQAIRTSLHDSDGIAGPAKRIEVSIAELSEVALKTLGKQWDDLTEDERHQVRTAIERVVKRHEREKH